MARYRPEPPAVEGNVPRTAVLLANLGTPTAPTAAALRPYLRQFLSDPRVVEIPRALWWPILNGFILTTRPRKSAEKYASVWLPEGSPLKVHTERQARLLTGYLGHAGLAGLHVDWAMRYGEPSIPAVLERLRAAGCTRILVMPLYPQYAASTTASVMDEVAHCLPQWRNLPEIRYVRSFHDDPGYIAALARSVGEHWVKHGRGDKLVLSFHGIPRRAAELGDPYPQECRRTADLLAAELGLPADQVLLTFQSRFGRAEWLQPYTQPTLEALAAKGLQRVDVMCPGFVADCLETLEEIAMECRTAFIGAGGRQFEYIPCLNENHPWIDALSRIVRAHLGNWLEAPLSDTPERRTAVAATRGG
ncbi:ferrochelatase [Pseudothauera rhizosphaerae]|uniref:Ferrochelatase n=1 Tax=Pseudothauera rhizosphaerae TaxID=2565932 RepID=A0A4S4AS34_9RHOO|nr:ferrochelatase [Pseudothauera rhizosphaerae]THF62518.1 ferrochelatase [Pseudothauera rhizosphaerae]